MIYTVPELYEVSLAPANNVLAAGPDSGSGCSSSCCFTRESDSW